MPDPSTTLVAQGPRGSSLGAAARPRARARRASERLLPALLVILSALLPSACSTPPESSQFVHPNADLALYPRIAILPLLNFASDRFAADRVREILVVEIASLGVFEVAETGKVNRVLRTLGVTDVAAIDTEMLAAIGAELQVQGLILGTVIDYRELRAGNLTAPEVSLSLKLVDVEGGVVVWSGSDALSGLTLKMRLFGLGQQSATSVVRDLIRSLMDSMLAEA